jgi:aldehyde dehydrogenase (NAD+)
LPSLLRKLFSEAIEADTFVILSSAPSSDTLSACLQVLHETHVNIPTYSQLVSPTGKVVAVVDRTADLASAAEQLVAARFAFGGTSPYAPDLVLVNEFAKRDFLEHAQKPVSRVLDAFRSLQDSKSWKTKVITQGDNGAVVELSNLCTLPPKVTQPLFCISAITSLEHAISLVDEDLEPSQTLSAAYHFGAPASGKYLSQFINADASFTNHVPYRLLLGPTAPSFQQIDIEKRYTTQHFTRASPAYISPSSAQAAMEKVVVGKDTRRTAADLLAKASQEIRENRRAESIAIGYFEQGIFLGLGVYGIPLLSCIGASLFFGIRAGLRRWVFA